MHLPSFLLCLAASVSGATAGVVQAPEVSGSSSSSSSGQPILFVGTYTRDEGWVNGTGEGIHAYTLDPSDGALTPLGVTELGVNPMYVQGSTKAFSHGKRMLYAINAVSDASEQQDDTETGYISALMMASDGSLELLNTLETHGGSPTHIALSPDEDFVTVSNYAGSLTMFPLEADGSLAAESFYESFPDGSEVVMDQQATGHIHSTTWLPGSNHVIAANLGSDELLQYALDESAQTLKSLKSLPSVHRPPGSGPRHMALHPNGELAYVVDEISNTVGVYELDTSAGSLHSTALQNISTLPESFTNTSTSADIHFSSDGNFLYTSNRGHNSIAIFEVDPEDGTLTACGWEGTRGKTPRGFIVYGDLLLVGNQDSNDLFVFKVEADTGALSYTGHSVDIGTPVTLYITEL